MNARIIFIFYFIINYVNGLNVSDCKKMGVINTELDSFTYQVYFCLESKIKFININKTKVSNYNKNLSNISFSKNISIKNLTTPHNFLHNTSIINKTIKKHNLSLNTPSPGISTVKDNTASSIFSYFSPSISSSISSSFSSAFSSAFSPSFSPSLVSTSYSSYKKTNLRSHIKYTSSTINQTQTVNASLKVLDSLYINKNNTNITNITNITNTKFLDSTIAYKEEINIVITISCSIVLFFLMLLIYYVAYKRYKKNSCKNKICPELILENGNSKKQSGEKISKSAKKYIVDESTDEISNVDSEILQEEAKTWYVNEFKKELDLLKETTDISNNSFT